MRVAVDGIRIFFDVVGTHLEPDGPAMREKPTLVLLHGGPGPDHSIYRPAFDRLSDMAQLIFVDHRGQGRSDDGHAAQWNLARWADDVVELCDALEIESPIVFGHSFGGMVAMAYATRHPEHPGRLILSGTYAKQDRAAIVDRFAKLGGAEVAAAARAFWTTPTEATNAEYSRLCLRHYTHRTLDASDVHAAMRAIRKPDPGLHFIGGEMQTMDLLPDLHRIRCPTLVLGAADDPVCPVDGAQAIASALPEDRVRFEHLEGCRHVFWADAPDAFFGALRRFIGEHAEA